MVGHGQPDPENFIRGGFLPQIRAAAGSLKRVV
jgi:hypothetical protein